MYEIQSRNLNQPYSTEWDPSAVGRDGNEFATEVEAEACIAQLRELGDDWAAAEYRVVPIGAAGRYAAIQVIWDADHGAANEGWYLRTRDQAGHIEDMRVESVEDLARDASDLELRDAAIFFLFGEVTDSESAALHCSIEVKR